MHSRTCGCALQKSVCWVSYVALASLALAAAPSRQWQTIPISPKTTFSVQRSRRSLSLRSGAPPTCKPRRIDAMVLTGDDIAKENINTVDQLQFTTPSVTIQDSGVNALINIRGIGRDDAGAQVSSGVLIYRDGVSTTPNGLISDEPYYDISSIEVLRGPAGHLRGGKCDRRRHLHHRGRPGSQSVQRLCRGPVRDLQRSASPRGGERSADPDDLAIRFATDDENRDIALGTMTGPWTGNPAICTAATWRVRALCGSPVMPSRRSSSSTTTTSITAARPRRRSTDRRPTSSTSNRIRTWRATSTRSARSSTSTISSRTASR